MKKKHLFAFLFGLIIISYLSLAFIFKNNPKDIFEISYKTFKILPIKVQVAIRGEELRLTSGKKDLLQKAIQLTKELEIKQPLQYINFRD